MSRAELTGTPRTRNCVACAGASFEARDELRKSWKRADLESVSVPRRAPRLAAVEVRCLVRLRCAAVGWLVGWLDGRLARSVERTQSLDTEGGREQRRRPSPLSSAESSSPPATDVRDGTAEQGSQGRAGA